jgi:hypothetical protein
MCLSAPVKWLSSCVLKTKQKLLTIIVWKIDRQVFLHNMSMCGRTLHMWVSTTAAAGAHKKTGFFLKRKKMRQTYRHTDKQTEVQTFFQSMLFAWQIATVVCIQLSLYLNAKKSFYKFLNYKCLLCLYILFWKVACSVF